MKKTLLAVALLLASTGVFAQVNVKDNATMNRGNMAVKQQSVFTLPAKKAVAKAHPAGTTLLTDFSNADSYAIGTAAGHSAVGKNSKFQIRPDTTSAWTGSQNEIVNYVLGLNTPGNWFRLQNSDWANMSAKNGFAYLDLESVTLEDNESNTVINAWIRPTQSINTYGLRGVDIYISQYCYRFNTDKYYIDWSHTEDFAVYDSMEFNARGYMLDPNEIKRGVTKITLPTNTSNCSLISEDPSEQTYIRIRVKCPAAGGNIHGYLFIVDDIAWAETPEYNLDVLGHDFYGGYKRVPEIVEVEPFFSRVKVNNSGANDLTNVTVKNNMVKANIIAGGSYDGTDSLDFDFNSDAVVTNIGVQDVLSTDAYEVEGRDENNNSIMLLRDIEWLEAYETNQLNDGTGYYSVINTLSYDYQEDGQTKTETISADIYGTIDDPLIYTYSVTQPADEEAGVYRWSRDASGTRVYDHFDHGYAQKGNNVYYGQGDVNAEGYRVCLGYSAKEFKEPAYAWGIEVVPAINCSAATTADYSYTYNEPGAMIKSSLWKLDLEAASNDDVIAPVLYTNAAGEEDQILESEIYEVQASDLFDIPAADMGKVFYVDGQNLNAIYLPFKNQSVQLEPNTLYYACYENVIDGKFQVAQSTPFSNVFRIGYSHIPMFNEETGKEEETIIYNLVVYSPGVPTNGQYQWTWGALYSHTDNVPLIRLMIGKNKGGLTDATENTASMNLFPNPAKDNAVLDYTLATSGKVTIEVSDLMGRTVLSLNEGMRNAGIANKANIDASKLANGSYICTVKVNGAKAATTKMVVNR